MKTFLKKIAHFLLAIAGTMTSCSVGPSYRPPCAEVPGQWKNKGCEEEEGERSREVVKYDDWWEIFGDEKLNELEAIALENNRDLYIAYERVQEFRALMGIAASNFYPQLNLNPLYTNTGELIKVYGRVGNPSLANIFRAHELLYYLPLNLTYEVDLWGRLQDRYDNAKYNWLAQKNDYEAVMLTLTSNLAAAYYQARAIDEQIDLLAKVSKTRQKAYQINLDRYEGQISFYADVTLAAEEIDSITTQYEEAMRQRKVIENQIAVLLGYPASEFCLEWMPLKGVLPCIPEGLPSEVLIRRPDVREAEHLAKAAHALVKEAYSEFFPSLTLTGTTGFESPVFRDFLKWISRYWMEGVQINQLVFDGFRTPYHLKAQMARFLEASGQYQKTILKAFQEVEDALSDVDAYAKEYESALETTQWAQKAYELYADRYLHGLINYLDVVNTERDLLNFQIQLNAIHGYQFLSTIQLVKALGGGWAVRDNCKNEKQDLQDR